MLIFVMKLLIYIPVAFLGKDKPYYLYQSDIIRGISNKISEHIEEVMQDAYKWN
jgi:hypothetical protein